MSEETPALKQVLDALRLGRTACEWSGKTAEADKITAAFDAARSLLGDAAAIRKAVLEERERCAKVCDEVQRQQDNDNGVADTGGASACVAAIRKGYPCPNTPNLRRNDG